jgi:signal transduction histidine kinase
VADVSHELRTPLTVIKGTVETLQAGAIDDRLARGAFLSSMEREADRMIRLVNDLLVLARADSGGLKLHPQPFDLACLAGERCAALQPAAARGGVRLRVEGPPAPISADPDRVAQVLDNLLSNAVRHSPAGGEVRVVVAADGRAPLEGAHPGPGVSCRVIDCGPGIAPEHLPFLFERFYRADPARDRLHGGSGLGLSIVRSLVLAHGGRVSVESTPGGGAAFTFWLPAIHFPVS